MKRQTTTQHHKTQNCHQKRSSEQQTNKQRIIDTAIQKNRTMSFTTTTTMTPTVKNKNNINSSTNTTTSSPTYARPPPSYKKKLEGLEATPALLELWKHAWNVVNSNASSSTHKTESSVTSSKSNDSNDVVQEASRRLTAQEAKTILLQCNITENEILKQKCIPILVIRAMETLFLSLDNNNHDSNINHHNHHDLEQALQKSKLVYTQPPVLTQQQERERQRFVQRMDRLALKDEERNYNKLTANLKTRASKAADDDITTKSMTYAASIGLNMIIAPLSFGCFMYFFAGGIFDFMGWTTTLQAGSVVDIKRVIVSVISGVAMLFIEMILFVIRTHEMDKAMRHKQSKSGGTSVSGAFGPYSAKMAREFKED